MTRAAAGRPYEPHPTIKLRDYQTAAIERIEGLLLHERKRSVLAVAPTGAGKGTIAVHLLAKWAREGKRVLYLVHRREIVHDIEGRLIREGITPGVIMGAIQPHRDREVQVASVQTLLHERRHPRWDLVVVDEAHHYAAKDWSAVMKKVRMDAVVGLTATPQRADGKPLGDMFGHLLQVVSYRELLRDGHIVPCRVLRPECPLHQDLAQDPARAYLAYAGSSRCFMFVRAVAEARAAAQTLQKVGVGAAVIAHDTPHDERRKAMEDLAAGRIRVIVNFYTMTEGIDIPAVSTVILGRSCAFEGSYMQMVGRALRAYPGKREALILDLTGASYQYGMPLDERTFQLRGRAIGREESEYRVRAMPERELQQVLNMQLVEATDEQQKRWGKRRINWAAVGLGQRPDADLARDLGIGVETIGAMRRRFGIQSYRQAFVVDKLIDWSAQPLGKYTDRSIAEKLGVLVDTVKRAREARKIPPLHRGRGLRTDVDWDAQPLGKVADKTLAKQLKVAQSTVLMARRARNIPPFGLGAKLASWDRIPLGKLPDTAVAAKYDLTLDAVRNARKRRGIPAYNDSPARPRALPDDPVAWDKVGLGERADRVIAQSLGVSIRRVRLAREERGIAPMKAGRQVIGHDWEKLGLGDEPDAVVAARAGCSVSYVKKTRRLLGKSRKGMRWADDHRWVGVQLGTMPDSAIAKQYGLKLDTVQKARQRRGIAPFRSTRVREDAENQDDQKKRPQKRLPKARR